MAANGTTFVKMKKTEENGNGNDNGNGTDVQNQKPKPVELDEDLRRKVESLQIGDRKDLPTDSNNENPEEAKSYDDWKDELPIHLKSLKFMIGVLNDRHCNRNQAPSGNSGGGGTYPKMSGQFSNSKLRNMDILETTWEDESTEMVFKKRPMRLPFHQYPTGLGRRPRMEASRNIPRRRTKSAEPDLSSYRNETPFGTRSYKHRDSDSGLNSSSTAWFRKRRSIDMNGVYVVEEITEEDEDSLELEHRKRFSSADGSPDSLSVEMELNNIHMAPAESILSPLKPMHRLRRDLWNISPISEDSDKEIETIVNNSNPDEVEDCSISSTNATFGDFTSSMSVTPRLNSCSSPILSHSPSLRKTPVTLAGGGNANVHTDTPPTSGAAAASGGVARKIRDIARALDDISDREEEPTATDESEDTEEEKTESFEIDLSADLSAGDSNALNLNTSLPRDKSSYSLKQDKEEAMDMEVGSSGDIFSDILKKGENEG